MKKVFICCSADRRLVLEAKAQVYKKWELTEQLERADLMAVVRNGGLTEEMKQMIKIILTKALSSVRYRKRYYVATL